MIYYMAFGEILLAHEPAIQTKTRFWSAVNFKKYATLMSSKTEAAIWSRVTGQRISCFDSCQLNIIGMLNIKDI